LKIYFAIRAIEPTLGIESSYLKTVQSLRECEIEIVEVIANQAISHRVGFFRRLFPKKLINIISDVSFFRKFLRSVATDSLIVLTGMWTAVPALLAAWNIKGLRFIIWEHSLHQARVDKTIGFTFLDFFAKKLYWRANKIVCVSPFVQDYIGRYVGLEKTVVIPNIVIESPNKETVKSQTPSEGLVRLVTATSLSKIKNNRLLLEVLAIAPENFRLTICGEGPEKDNLYQFAQDLGIEDRVAFTGFLPKDALRGILSQSDVFIHSSLAETFGLALIEASTHNLPVVCGDAEAMKQMVPRFAPGRIAEYSPTKFLEAVQDVLNNPPTDEDFKLAQAARQRKFGVTTVREKWFEVLGGSDG